MDKTRIYILLSVREWVAFKKGFVLVRVEDKFQNDTSRLL